MSKKFYAVNKTTGEKWKPDKNYKSDQYLVLYDSGYPAVVTHYSGWEVSVVPLDLSKWTFVIEPSILKKNRTND